MNGLHGLEWAALASSYALGLALAAWNDLKPCLARRLSLQGSEGNALASALYLTLIPLTPLAGLLVDAWGVREVFSLGTLVTALAFFALAVGKTYRGCFRAALLAGAGLSGLNCGAVALMPLAFFEHDPPAALNLGFVYVGLGALTTPIIFAPLTRTLGPRRALILLAVLCLVPAAVMMLAPGDVLLPAGDAPAATALFGDAVPWLAGLAFLFYNPLEGVLGTRAATHLVDLASPPRRAAVVLTLVWTAFLASRLLMALFLQQDWLNPIADGWLMLILAVWAAIALGNLAGTHSPTSAAWGLVVIGACLGPIFPTVVGLVFRSVGPGAYGTAYGVMYAVGVTGSLALTPLLAGSTERGKALRGVPLVLSGIVLAAACAVLALLVER